MNAPAPGWARPILGLAAMAYATLVAVRNRRFDRLSAVWRAPIPVLSVGNLTVGGTGKTPLVAWLARRLLAAGRRPAVVSRGYGGRAGRGPLVVSRGAGPLCEADRCGDEPYLLAASLRQIAVVVGSDRPAAVRAAAQEGAGIAILDDGFQHRRLHRDLDVVLLDGDAPFGNGRLLPAGPLREPRSSLVRADVLVLTRTRPDDDRAAARQLIRTINPRAPVLRAGHRAVGFVDPHGVASDPPARAIAFCGIAGPERFLADLLDLGIEVVELRPYRDHHRYSAREIEDLARRALEHGCDLVTTEKDLARIGSAAAAAVRARLLALRIEAVVHDPAALDEAVERALGAGGCDTMPRRA